MSQYRPERIEFIAEMESAVPGGSTFFRRGYTTENHATKEITTKDGRVLNVPTIHDVVRWAHTARGGKQYALFPDEDFEQPSACSVGGYCE